MVIGMMGLGKLGLPVGLYIEKMGHKVIGYDPSDQVKEILESKKLKYQEKGAQELLNDTEIKIQSVNDLVKESDLIFVAIQTPHVQKYEGITRLPKDRLDFDYSFLKKGIKQLSESLDNLKVNRTVIIISTVLPGTIEREIRPLMSRYMKLCYNPFFIAMGTTIDDFKNPEFVLFGVDDKASAEFAKCFYSTIHDKPVFETTIENAELIKVLYNTYISSKIAIANTIMEICQKTNNTDCDEVVDALSLATERLISNRYMRGGMGDGGGCHPRDNIALSWLSKKLDLSYDWFENIMVCRENQTEWLANIIIEYKNKNPKLPIVIFGMAFKKGTNLTVGSPSILLKNILNEKNYDVVMADEHVEGSKNHTEKLLESASIFFIGTNHNEFITYRFPNNSIVIDPWRIIPKNKYYKVISLGAKC